MSLHTFADQVCQAVKEKQSHAVIGLDPVLSRLPEFIKKEAREMHGETSAGAAYAFLQFNKLVIDAVADDVAVVKPQLAYYEVYGAPGIEAFWNTVDYAQEKGLLVVADAKRGDIDSTAFFGSETIEWRDKHYVNALTINPYLGSDSIEPFVKRGDACGAGLFVLVKTSNPTSGDIQDRLLAEEITVSDRGRI